MSVDRMTAANLCRRMTPRGISAQATAQTCGGRGNPALHVHHVKVSHGPRAGSATAMAPTCGVSHETLDLEKERRNLSRLRLFHDGISARERAATADPVCRRSSH